jgi:hypothetical protein
VNQLPNVLRPLEIFQSILAQISQAEFGGQAFPHDVGGDRRNQYLRSMRNRSKSCAVIDGWTVIIPTSGIGFTCVQSHAYPKRHILWPRFIEQCDLDGTRGCNALGSPIEDREAAVTLPAGSDDLAGVVSDEFFN